MVGARARLSARAAAVAGVLLATAVAVSGCSGAGGIRHLTGDLQTHDPALTREGDDWYVYSTGNGTVADGNIQIRSSRDGSEWRYEGEVWDEKPGWLTEAVPGVDNLWAPELIEHEGTWYLYYSASTFGKNSSVIALATNLTLDPDEPDYEWVDRGPVIESTTSDDFNAIDAGIIDTDGTPWMAFGSFWSGIRMVELEWPSGLRADADAEPLRLADRGAPPNAIEAPFLVEHDGDYFLFVSRDACCQGAKSTYNIAVGRADAPTGPFLDRDGVPLLEDGGTTVLATDGPRIGPGGQSVADGMLAFHFYDGDQGGAFRLALAPISWDADGWPNVSW